MALQISGLTSSLDTTAIISQLMEVEANPQTLLKNQLVAVQADAAAYRAVNTRFDALRTAAAALTADTAWTAMKATSNNTAVTASAGTSAIAGSLAFHVDELATNHSVISTRVTPWTATTDAYGAASIDVTVGGTTTSIAVGGTGTLADAVAAINANTTLGLTATAVQTSPGKFQLQVSSKTTGAAAAFTLNDGTNTWGVVTQGVDAQVTVGTGPGKFSVTSSTNTFSGIMADTTFTVNQKGIDAAVTVAGDPAAVSAKVKNLVDTANSLLDSIASYTDSDSASAVLKGDTTLRALAGRILDVVSSAVGSQSASVAGLQVTKDGHLTFDSAKFTAKLTSDPSIVKDIFTSKTVTGVGADGVSGTADDVTAPVGVAAQLEAMAKSATDTTTGTLTTLAAGEDARAKDLQDRIDNWDIRLDLRRKTLQVQFTAMETALATLQNQQSWLTSQLGALPSWSTSSSSKS